ncbi:DUF4142 domain-containing protein [Methylobacterium nodulans]|uniref:DUF4142 domain-containing protein n=1 Tax=Methylobacterium nodulans (strain LMG 21967 / CNCM I-2342 / ORS 2060) TaxID=460265 RepID=B8IU87_METNO|nr:DUF4142 domain-containing protein [Methylobacterium nodulans]ACL55132.1 conserved hypothetical protein [Methylobacterium nodulans ORS 2060]
MDRRLALTALASAFAIPSFIGAAFAQNEPSSASKSTGNTGARMGEAEAKHAADTLAAGSLALAASRIALKKAKDDDVKQFAQFEVAEQETIADVLKAMRDPSTPASGQVKAPSEPEVTGQIDSRGKATLDKLEQAKAGPAFDAEYIKGQIEGHQSLLKIQEDYLATGKDRENLGAAKLARGMIKEHLALLSDIKKDLKE